MKEFEAENTDIPEDVLNALLDDLNTPQAMAALNMLLKQENSATLKGQLFAVGSVLGVLQEDPAAWLGLDCDVDFDALLEERAQAKADKNWARADEIRDEIAAQGYEIIDTPDGAQIKKI
jgi:cysteinyl-tRNA synthetase